MNRNFCSIFYHFVYPPSISNLSVMEEHCDLLHSWYIPQTLERYCDVPECKINQNHNKEVGDKKSKTGRTLKTLLKKNLYTLGSLLSHGQMRLEQSPGFSHSKFLSHWHPYLSVVRSLGKFSPDINEWIGTDIVFLSEYDTELYQANWRKQHSS